VITSNSGASAFRNSTNSTRYCYFRFDHARDGWLAGMPGQYRENSRVPIMILSVLDNPGLVARALDMGADDFLVKPVKSAVLIAHLHNLTRRSSEVNPHTAPLKSDSFS